MKKKNSVFNNFNSDKKVTSDIGKNFSSKNSMLNTQTEFATQFFDNEPEDDTIQHQKRERKATSYNDSSSKN